MVLHVKLKARRYYAVNQRDTHALTCLERIKCTKLMKNIDNLCETYKKINYSRYRIQFTAEKAQIRAIILSLYTDFLKIIIVDIPEKPIKVVYPPMSFGMMDAHLMNHGTVLFPNFVKKKDLLAPRDFGLQVYLNFKDFEMDLKCLEV